MGAIDVTGLSYRRPGGRQILVDVGFHVGNGQHVALVGPNGAGKTTLLRLLNGEEEGAAEGGLRIDGRHAVMPQMIGMMGGDGATVRDLLLVLAPPAARAAAAALRAAETRPEDGVALAARLCGVGRRRRVRPRGVLGRVCTRATGSPLDELAARPVSTLSGGEQKKLALQVLLNDDSEVLLLDEPDNFLDIPGKRWLEGELNGSKKTILFVSHDRELLSATAHKIVTIEDGRSWTHGASFATYHDARQAHVDRLDDDFKRWKAERDRLFAFMKEMKRRAAINDGNAARRTRRRRGCAAGMWPGRPRHRRPSSRSPCASPAVAPASGRSRASSSRSPASRNRSTPRSNSASASVCSGPTARARATFSGFSPDGEVAHTGEARLGARVVPGHFSQTNERPELGDIDVREVLEKHGLGRGPAMATLRRYELHTCAEQPFSTLSGGQQARLQVLLLELGGATMLLLDEPTDNLDLASAEALQDAIAAFAGTVLVVTHDRWFMRSLDRFLIFAADGRVREAAEPEFA